jgi:putative Mn2+ efflux pump MntP
MPSIAMPVSILVLALALAMDATAVAAARAAALPHLRMRDVALVALVFGGLQAAMPLIGAFAGARAGPYVAAWDHWIAFALLAAIGAKMLWEARGARDAADARAQADATLGVATVLLLGVATSIDALAAGITLPLMGAPLAVSIATIGVVTATLSAAGMILGRRVGRLFGRRLELLGGVALIGLGVKILLEHLRA